MGPKVKADDAYYEVGYSTKSGFQAGAQSLNAGDDYSPPNTDVNEKTKIRRSGTASKFSRDLLAKKRKRKKIDY